MKRNAALGMAYTIAFISLIGIIGEEGIDMNWLIALVVACLVFTLFVLYAICNVSSRCSREEEAEYDRKGGEL